MSEQPVSCDTERHRGGNEETPQSKFMITFCLWRWPKRDRGARVQKRAGSVWFHMLSSYQPTGPSTSAKHTSTCAPRALRSAFIAISFPRPLVLWCACFRRCENRAPGIKFKKTKNFAN